MIKSRTVIVALCAFLAGIGAVAALTVNAPNDIHDPFEGLRLGMSVDDAFATMRKLDAAAFEGPVCSGENGIAARVRHLGMSWQLSAHTKDGRIDEYVLERNSIKETVTAEQCRSTFETHIVPHYNRKHKRSAWSTLDEPHHLHVLHTTSTQHASFVALFAGRRDREDAVCTYRIVYR